MNATFTMATTLSMKTDQFLICKTESPTLPSSDGKGDCLLLTKASPPNTYVASVSLPDICKPSTPPKTSQTFYNYGCNLLTESIICTAPNSLNVTWTCPSPNLPDGIGLNDVQLTPSIYISNNSQWVNFEVTSKLIDKTKITPTTIKVTTDKTEWDNAPTIPIDCTFQQKLQGSASEIAGKSGFSFLAAAPPVGVSAALTNNAYSCGNGNKNSSALMFLSRTSSSYWFQITWKINGQRRGINTGTSVVKLDIAPIPTALQSIGTIGDITGALFGIIAGALFF